MNAGAPSLAALVEQATGRIEIALGGGLRLADAARLAKFIGARHFHASLRQREAGSGLEGTLIDRPMGDDRYFVRAEAVRAMIDELQKEEITHG